MNELFPLKGIANYCCFISTSSVEIHIHLYQFMFPELFYCYHNIKRKQRQVYNIKAVSETVHTTITVFTRDIS